MSEQTISEEARKIAEMEAYGAENDEPYGHFVQQALSTRDQEIARLKQILTKQGYDISQTLGKALGYITDDPDSNVGEHIAETLADEAGKEIARLKEELGGIALVYETNRDELLERIHQLESVIESPEGEIKRLNARISELEKEQGEEDETELSALHAENTELRARITDLEKVSDIKSAALVDANQNAIQLTTRIADMERERDELRAWKESILKVESSWDVQAVGKLIEVPLGKAIQPCIEPYIRKLRADLEAKEKECNEADRRAGRAERKVAHLVDSKVRRESWLDEAKRAWGVSTNISFDVIWEECLQLRTKLTDSEARCEKLEEAVNYSIKALVSFNSDVFYASGEPIGEPFDPAPNYIHVYWKLASALKPSTEK